MKRLAIVLALLIACVGLEACGGGSGSTSVSSTVQPQREAATEKTSQAQGSPRTNNPEQTELTLDSPPNAYHAGILMAQKLGYFDEAGLDVVIRTPSDPSTPIEEAADGRSDFAVTAGPEVILGIERGLDIVPAAALIDDPLTALVWLKDGQSDSVADLRGKTVATSGIPYQNALLKAILHGAGVSQEDVDMIDAGFELLPTLADGRAEALLGDVGSPEKIELQLPGNPPEVTPVEKLGVPAYAGLVLVGARERLERDPQPVRSVIAALAKGTKAALDDPAAATEALLKANPQLSPKLARAEIDAAIPALKTAAGTSKQPFGYTGTPQWARLARWMNAEKLTSFLIATASLYINVYLPR